MLVTIVLLLAGFFLLVKGADFFVDGASSIARYLRIPSIIVGLTIVAFGTSAPELSVSISAAMQGSNEIAVSNVLGSNIFNLLVVTGVCAVIATVPVSKTLVNQELPFSIIAAVLLIPFALLGTQQMMIGRMEGLILLALFVLYIIWQIRDALKSRKETVEDPMEKIISPLKSIILIVLGCIMIVVGGNFVVNSATSIAQAFGLSETLIGLTIVAIGTSLPELVTSIVASRKGENDLSLGNVVGSNIFNILMILGISTTIHPIQLESSFLFDTLFLAAVSVIILIFAKTKGKISRKEGLLMLAFYIAYDAYIILR